MNLPLTIRLIIDPAQSGPWNMAADEALMKSVGGEFSRAEEGHEDDDSPVLRFYLWDEPTLSLGYFQPYQLRELHGPSSSISLVRRNSGGGAIVHHHELTYSLTVPESWVGSDWLKSSTELYSKMHDSLIGTLEELGVEAGKIDQLDESLEGRFLCFQRRAPNDVVVSGNKVCGSAQRKKYHAISQHGSVILDTSSHAPEISGINPIAQTSLQVADLIERWTATLSEREGLAFVPSKLSEKEEFEAQNLVNAKFSTLSWNQKR